MLIEVYIFSLRLVSSAGRGILAVRGTAFRSLVCVLLGEYYSLNLIGVLAFIQSMYMYVPVYSCGVQFFFSKIAVSVAVPSPTPPPLLREVPERMEPSPAYLLHA